MKERLALLELASSLDRDDILDERLRVAAQPLLIQAFEQRPHARRLFQVALPQQPDVAPQARDQHALLPQHLDQPHTWQQLEVDAALIPIWARRSFQPRVQHLLEVVIRRQPTARIAHAVRCPPAIAAHTIPLAAGSTQRALNHRRGGLSARALRDDQLVAKPAIGPPHCVLRRLLLKQRPQFRNTPREGECRLPVAHAQVALIGRRTWRWRRPTCATAEEDVDRASAVCCTRAMARACKVLVDVVGLHSVGTHADAAPRAAHAAAHAMLVFVPLKCGRAPNEALEVSGFERPIFQRTARRMAFELALCERRRLRCRLLRTEQRRVRLLDGARCRGRAALEFELRGAWLCACRSGRLARSRLRIGRARHGHIVQRLADCLLPQGSGKLVARGLQVPVLEAIQEIKLAFGVCERA